MPADDKDYYDILSVQRDAADRDIRLAYRKLAMQLHPDRNQGASAAERAAATERFTLVGEAYAVLSDPDKRALYDQYGLAGLQGQERMSAEKAMQMYWDFFKVPGWQRGATASAKHGMYVASAGAVTAPLKGVGLGGAIMGAGVLAGVASTAGGMYEGGRDFVQGARELGGAQQAPVPEGQDQVGAGRKMSHLVTKPIQGTLRGVATIGLAGVAGVGTIVAGGFGGAVYSVKEGVREIRDARQQQPQPLPPPPVDDAGAAAAAFSTADKGRGLFARSMSGQQV